jgi:predicted phage terminase large subunit-like protein
LPPYEAVSPLMEAGNLYLPHPMFMPWDADFLEECAAFPNGAHDVRSMR